MWNGQRDVRLPWTLRYVPVQTFDGGQRMGVAKKAWELKKRTQPSTVDTLRGLGRVLSEGGLSAGMSPLAIRRAAKQVQP
jgi:hypothetical protein